MERSDLINIILTVVTLGYVIAWLSTRRKYKHWRKESRKWCTRADHYGKRCAILEADLATTELLYENENGINRDLRKRLADVELKIKDRADVANVKETEEDFDDSELDELIKDDADDEKNDAGD